MVPSVLPRVPFPPSGVQNVMDPVTACNNGIVYECLICLFVGQVRDVYLAMNGNSVYYTGVKKGKIVSHSTDLELKPKQCNYFISSS